MFVLLCSPCIPALIPPPAPCPQTQKHRKDSKAKFFAKTRRGQPIMRHRLDKILDALQRDK